MGRHGLSGSGRVWRSEPPPSTAIGMEESRGDGEVTGGSSSKRKRGGDDGGFSEVVGPANAADSGREQEGNRRPAGVCVVVVNEDELMHPDFEELARQYPPFEAVYRRHRHLLPAPSAGSTSDHSNANQGRDGGATTNNNGGTMRGSKLQQAMAAPEFRLELTRALLRRHWNLRIPSFDSDTHLCPPVPNRYYFVKWLRQVVLDPSSQQFHSGPSPANEVVSNETHPLRGLDIGTGAAAVYALLWAATHTHDTATNKNPPLEMYGTDVDEQAVEQAQNNVTANQSLLWAEHKSRVHVLAVPACDRQRDPSQEPSTQPSKESAMEVEVPSTTSVLPESQNATSGPLVGVPRGPLRVSLQAVAEIHRNQDSLPTQSGPVRLDFCLTNPPFFDVHEDREDRADGHSRAVMTHDEGCYPGGEYAFLVDMIADGLYLHHQARGEHRQQPMDQLSLGPGLPPPRWMACMCGKKTTFTKIRGILRYVLGRSRVLSTEFGPGFMTRWFVAWTMTERPTINSPLASFTTFSFRIPLPLRSDRHPPTHPLEEVEDRIREYCESFPGVTLQVHADRTQGRDDGDAASNLRMTVRPQHAEVCSDQDDTLPEPIRTVLSMISTEQRMEWLPVEGHFSLELNVSPTAVSSSTPELIVSVEAFVHNRLGRTVVERVQVQLEGEINRTNRRWRRILQRQQKQQQGAPEAMDET